MRRHEITDEQWERIKDLLPGQEGDPGVTAKDNRLFVNAVLWIAKTGAPWRDLPERFGNWNSVWRRFDRWAQKGVWRRVFEELKDPDLARRFINRIKQYRRVATRYEKTARNFLGFIHVAAIMVLLL